jgi:hypothetical protein
MVLLPWFLLTYVFVSKIEAISESNFHSPRERQIKDHELSPEMLIGELKVAGFDISNGAETLVEKWRSAPLPHFGKGRKYRSLSYGFLNVTRNKRRGSPPSSNSSTLITS